MDSVVQVCGEESVAEQVKMIHGFHLKEPLTLIIHCDACSLNLGRGATSGLEGGAEWLPASSRGVVCRTRPFVWLRWTDESPKLDASSDSRGPQF